MALIPTPCTRKPNPLNTRSAGCCAGGPGAFSDLGRGPIPGCMSPAASDVRVRCSSAEVGFCFSNGFQVFSESKVEVFRISLLAGLGLQLRVSEFKVIYCCSIPCKPTCLSRLRHWVWGFAVDFPVQGLVYFHGVFTARVLQSWRSLHVLLGMVQLLSS